MPQCWPSHMSFVFGFRLITSKHPSSFLSRPPPSPQGCVVTWLDGAYSTRSFAVPLTVPTLRASVLHSRRSGHLSVPYPRRQASNPIRRTLAVVALPNVLLQGQTEAGWSAPSPDGEARFQGDVSYRLPRNAQVAFVLCRTLSPSASLWLAVYVLGRVASSRLAQRGGDCAAVQHTVLAEYSVPASAGLDAKWTWRNRPTTRRRTQVPAQYKAP